MHFQNSLPRLPIPELEKTCERYINSVKPLLTADELQKTIGIVENFKSSPGKELQEELKSVDAKNKHTSYISGPWFDMYLKSRTPLVLNYNPFLSFKDDPKSEFNTQLLRATNMVFSSLRFMKSLHNNLLEPEVYHLNAEKSDTQFFRKTMRLMPKRFAWYGAYLFKAFPLDMSQFKNLFCSTRIPHLGKDEIKSFPDSRHIAVLRNGNIYVFDAIDGHGDIIPPSHISSCINYILSDTQPSSKHPVPALTSQERDTWAKAREHLVKIGNSEQLQLVDSAIFLLILDDENFDAEKDLVPYARQMLHGHSHNRWFDKSFSLIITKDGKAALNFEHAWGDGVAVMRYFNEIYKDSTANHFVGPKTLPANIDPSSLVKRLDFQIDDQLKSEIKMAEEKFNELTSTLQLDVMQHNLLHRECIKSFKLSPDSIVQLGLQMAFYKLHGKFVATYESCSTSAFKHGRTETVRPLTTATRKCVEEFHKRNTTDLKGLMVECTKVHNQLTKEAAMGQGFDRHLFGLRIMAEKLNQKVPHLFEDPSFVKANHFVISTSTLFGFYFSGGGFGPVVKDGFGIAYGFLDNQLGCLVSSYKTHQDGAAFVDALRSSYDEIYNSLSKR
ncbi:carnitine O-palmitoyltransferase 2, mitochondrial isoform X2 [Parasteatoda tepidariorum]|nr:carnitine O-palmitoyltransferase 2, mitochondrial isoform X2 [Parasteatoda tepidariorum]